MMFWGAALACVRRSPVKYVSGCRYYVTVNKALVQSLHLPRIRIPTRVQLKRHVPLHYLTLSLSVGVLN
jgi:hypothetical protein